MIQEKAQPKYYFSIDAGLRGIGQEPRDTKNPRGARFQVAFQNGNPTAVYTDKELFRQTWDGEYARFECVEEEKDGKKRKTIIPPKGTDKRKWNGLEGPILGGGDFFLVRSDGVLELDGRVTLRAAPDDTLIDVKYSGVVDIAESVADPELQKALTAVGASRPESESRVSEAFERFIHGSLELTKRNGWPSLPVRLAVTFELATGPWSTVEGEDTSWMKDRYLDLQEHVWRYEVLTRKQFLAEGILVFDQFVPARLPSAKSIKLHVLELTHSLEGRY